MQDDTHGPTVNFRAIGLLNQQLRSEAVHRAQLQGGRLARIVGTGHAEVGQFQLHDFALIRVVDQEIFKLDVPVDNVLFVANLNGQCHLIKYLTYLFLRQLALAITEQIAQVRPHQLVHDADRV